MGMAIAIVGLLGLVLGGALLNGAWQAAALVSAGVLVAFGIWLQRRTPDDYSAPAMGPATKDDEAE